jgi:aspartate kinase
MNVIKYGGSVLDRFEVFESIGEELSHGNSIVIFSAIKGLSRLLKQMISDSINGESVDLYHLEERLLKFGRIDKTVSKHVSELKRLLTGIRYTKEASPKVTDVILVKGEIITSVLLRNHLDAVGIEYVHFDSSQYFYTEGSFGISKPNTNKIKESLRECIQASKGKSILMEGFIGIGDTGFPTTMGFESSNLTAIVVAYIAGTDSISYISKVNGIYSIDPELYHEAKPVARLNTYDAIKMSNAAVRILHKESLEFAERNGISLRYCGQKGECNTLITKGIETSYPLISIAGSGLGSTNPSFNILSIILPKRFEKNLSIVLDKFSSKSLSSTIYTVQQTRSKVITIQTEELTSNDIRIIHDIFDNNIES